MAFKNALKMLVSKFGLMWVLLLYIIITGAIVVSLSLPFALPVLRVFKSEGVGKLIYSLFSSSSVGDGIDVWFDNAYAVVRAMKNSLIKNRAAAFSTGALIVFVLIFAYRFIFELYEIPLLNVLEGAMSSNARIGFTGRYVSNIGKSSKFALVKMLYTIVFDAIIVLAVYWLFVLFNVRVLKLFAPFVIMLVLLVLLAFRYAFISMWAPNIVIRDGGIFRSFGFSFKRVFRNMGSVFTTFLISWTLIIAVNLLVGVFTFGAGLILTVPLSLLFINLLNMAVYYGKDGKRYYVDSATVVTPPVVSE